MDKIYIVPTNVNTFNWPIKTSTHLERPRFILFALQIDRSESLTKKVSEFDHGNLSNVRAYINSEVYPYTALNVNFEEFKYAHLFLHFLNLKKIIIIKLYVRLMLILHHLRVNTAFGLLIVHVNKKPLRRHLLMFV